MVHLSKYGGHSVKDLARILNLSSDTKVSQAMEPMLDKIGKMLNPELPEDRAVAWQRFIGMVLYAATERAPISDDELNSRCEMLSGRRP